MKPLFCFINSHHSKSAAAINRENAIDSLTLHTKIIQFKYALYSNTIQGFRN